MSILSEPVEDENEYEGEDDCPGALNRGTLGPGENHCIQQSWLRQAADAIPFAREDEIE